MSAGRINTFTKLAVAVILVNAAAWVWCSYGLAYLGRYEIAESLSEKAIETIIGTFVTYALKSGIENVSKYGIKLPTASQSTAKTGQKRDY